MMDATHLYPQGFHPVYMDSLPDGFTPAKPLSKHGHLVQYYYIDFGISVRIAPQKQSKLVTGQDGQDREPPELHRDEPYDPFKLDIFLVGNVLRYSFYQVGLGIQCLLYANADTRLIIEIHQRRIFAVIGR